MGLVINGVNNKKTNSLKRSSQILLRAIQRIFRAKGEWQVTFEDYKIGHNEHNVYPSM